MCPQTRLHCFVLLFKTKKKKPNKQAPQNLTSCSCVLLDFSTVSFSLSWRRRAWGVVGASCRAGQVAPVAHLLLPQPPGRAQLSLLIKVDGKPFSHNYSELKKKFLDWEWSDKRSEPSSSHKEKQLKAASQEEIVTRTLNIMQLSVFLQCISHGENFLQFLRHGNLGKTLESFLLTSDFKTHIQKNREYSLYRGNLHPYFWACGSSLLSEIQ